MSQVKRVEMEILEGMVSEDNPVIKVMMVLPDNQEHQVHLDLMDSLDYPDNKEMPEVKEIEVMLVKQDVMALMVDLATKVNLEVLEIQDKTVYQVSPILSILLAKMTID